MKEKSLRAKTVSKLSGSSVLKDAQKKALIKNAARRRAAKTDFAAQAIKKP